MATFNVEKARASGVTDQEIDEYLKSHPGVVPSSPINKSNQEAENKSFFKKAYDILSIPEQKSKEGLGMIEDVTNKIPQSFTGNLSRDVAVNTPGVLAQSVAKTAKVIAPGFVSPLAVAGYAAAPAIGAAGRSLAPFAKGIANQLEQASGIAPKAEGALTEAAKDASLIFSKSKKMASPLYDAAKNEATTNLFKGMYKPEQIMDTAISHMEEGGKLLPKEALTARKAADSLLNSKRYVKDELVQIRNLLDKIAKGSENISEADSIYKRGRMAESLRNIFPQNKYGGASPFKMMMAGLAKNPLGLAGDVSLFSPIVQGAGATVLGIAGRAISNPKQSYQLLALLNALKKEKDNGTKR